MLIEAFAGVARQLGDVDLLLIGDGPLRSKLEAQVRDAGIADRVKFLGVRSDVGQLLMASDLFVLASVSEAASITMLEAMASGLPIVATAVGGNPEMVRQNIDGVLVPRGDAAAMTAALIQVLGNGTLAREMGRQGAERVRSLYRLDRTVERYAQMYRELQARRQHQGD